MGDAEIVPIGTRGRPGRGTGKRPSSTARNLAQPGPGAARSDGAPGSGASGGPTDEPSGGLSKECSLIRFAERAAE